MFCFFCSWYNSSTSIILITAVSAETYFFDVKRNALNTLIFRCAAAAAVRAPKRRKRGQIKRNAREEREKEKEFGSLEGNSILPA